MPVYEMPTPAQSTAMAGQLRCREADYIGATLGTHKLLIPPLHDLDPLL
jgi:hypothetical protein